ncbi:MAG TPA: trigger factor [Candidatus Cloacimonadota bacterium]|nr:trigger factor [Candidatus Cloacimonadota bacterium]HQL14952.1 trigger factor [Candidatus Cloacimonadota bacterium]
MQVEFNQINGARKQISLTVEKERAQAAYEKFLAKSAQNAEIQGFRKGKAPLSYVEKLYGPKIKSSFEDDFVEEVFSEAAKEYDINYLMFPEVKEINWEKGQDMNIKIEIEVEPEVNFKQIEGLRVPYRQLKLEDEVQNYLEDLRYENAVTSEVDDAIQENDEVEFEVRCIIDGEELVDNFKTQIIQYVDKPLADASYGKRIGESFTFSLTPKYLVRIFRNPEYNKHEGNVEATFMVNSVRRMQLPVIDDEFAKDLDFDNAEDMYAKITEEMREKNKEKNQNIKINALLTKLYVDNRFDLPEQTIQYLTQKELDQNKIKDPQWRKYYEQQIGDQIRSELITMYIMNALQKLYHVEPTEDDINRYIEHEAKLRDMSIEEWKEKNKEILDSENFKETISNYVILNRIAETSEFYEEEEQPEPEEEAIQTEESTEE